MAEQDNIGLFSQFGFTGQTEEEMLDEATKARVQTALAMQPQQQTFAGERDIRTSGAFLGAALRNKFDKPELTAQQKLELAMRDSANNSVKDRFANDQQWAAEAQENPQLVAIETLRGMSKFAFDAGNVQMGAELSAEAGRRYIEYRKQREEIAKLQEDTTSSRETRERLSEEHDRKLAEATQIVVPGSNGRYDLSGKLEDQMLTGRYDKKEGYFVDDQGNKIDNFMTLEEAINLRTLYKEEMKAAALDPTTTDPSQLPWEVRKRLFDSSIVGSERTGLRSQFDALDTQSAIMDTVVDMMYEMDKEGKQPGEFLDGAGEITQFVTNVKSAAKNVGATWTVQIASGSPTDLAEGKGQALYNGPDDKKLVEDFGQYIELPEGMDETGNKAAVYRSSIIQLAYAVARSNEPGARQLSDADFRNAIKEIGAAAASPERLRRVIFTNFSRKTKLMEGSMQRVGEIAESVGLPAEWGLDNVFGGTSRRAKLDRWNTTKGRFEKLKGDLELMEQSRDLDMNNVGVPAPTGTGTPDDPIVLP